MLYRQKAFWYKANSKQLIRRSKQNRSHFLLLQEFLRCTCRYNIYFMMIRKKIVSNRLIRFIRLMFALRCVCCVSPEWILKWSIGCLIDSIMFVAAAVQRLRLHCRITAIVFLLTLCCVNCVVSTDSNVVLIFNSHTEENKIQHQLLCLARQPLLLSRAPH